MKSSSAIFFLSLAVALASSLGCRRQETAPPSEASSSTNAVALPLTNGAASPEAAPAQTLLSKEITRLTETFQSAPETTRNRIDAALETIRSGKKSEGITALKLVDADSELTAEQTDSIRRVIMAVRKE